MKWAYLVGKCLRRVSWSWYYSVILYRTCFSLYLNIILYELHINLFIFLIKPHVKCSLLKVILTRLWTQEKIPLFSSTTGRWRACSWWNCSINTYHNLLFSCWFMVHIPHKLWHCITLCEMHLWKWMPTQSECNLIFLLYISTDWHGVSYLFSSSLMAATLERNLYELRVLFGHWILVTNFTNENLSLRFWWENILTL